MPDGASLGDGTEVIKRAEADIGMPNAVHGSFQGAARTFQQSLGEEPLLIAFAILTIYLVLGMLCGSYIAPLTVLSTLPWPASAPCSLCSCSGWSSRSSR